MFNLAVGLVGAAVLVLLAPWMVISLFRLPAEFQVMARVALYFIGINWALTMVNQTYVGALTALQNYRLVSVGSLTMQGGTLAVGIAVLLCGGNLLNLVFSQSVCLLLGSIFWWWTVRRALPDFMLSPHWSLPAIRRTVGMGVWQTVNKIGGIFSNRAQYWLLGISLPVATVGYYNLDYQIVILAYLISYKVGQVLFPAVSHLQGQGREDEAARHTISATWLCSLFGVSIMAAVLCLAQDFLRLWVGEAVAQASAPTLRVLALHTAVSMAFAVPSFYLLGTGRSRWLAIMALFQGVITFGTAYILLPVFGLIGAAWGVMAGTIVHVVVLVLIWQLIMRHWIEKGVFLSAVFGPMLTGMLAGGLLMWLRSLLAATLNWPQLILAGIGCVLIAIFLMLCVDSLLPDATARRQHLLKLVAQFRIPLIARRT